MKLTIAGLGLAAAVALAAAMPAAAAEIAFLKDQKSGEVAAARLAGTRVFNAKGEVIGQINDIVLDATGQAQAVVIGLGGFLGIGSHLVAVPYSALKIGPVVESARVVLLDVTKEQLASAPVYSITDPGAVDRGRQKASEWAKMAKEKAIELGKQAGTAIEGMREKMSQPPAQQPAPAPK